MGIISILLVSVLHHFPSGVLLGVLNVGHRPVSCERNFIRLPFTPPHCNHPSVLQLVSEPVRSLVVLNRLCDRRRHGERCRKACGFQWRGFRLLKKPDSQLSFELGSCYLGDSARSIRGPSDAQQHDPR
jgi:hypothetical protein